MKSNRPSLHSLKGDWTWCQFKVLHISLPSVSTWLFSQAPHGRLWCVCWRQVSSRFPTLCTQTFSSSFFPPGRDLDVNEGKVLRQSSPFSDELDNWEAPHCRRVAAQKEFQSCITNAIFSAISIIDPFIIMIGALHYHQSSWRHIGSLPHQHDLATFSHCTGLPVETCAFGKELWKEEPSRLVPSLLNIDCILICNTLFSVYIRSLLFIYYIYQVQAQVTCEVFKIKTMWQDGSYLVTHITVLEYLGNFCNYHNWHAQWVESCTSTPRNRSVPTNMKLLVDLSQNAVTGPKLDDCLSYGFWQLAFSFYANPDKWGYK